MAKRFVVLESPYAGDLVANLDYARKILRNSIERGETPFMSHLLYTQVLNDLDPDERKRGINLNLNMICLASAVVVYTDRGISSGMQTAINHARHLGVPVLFRSILQEPLNGHNHSHS